MRHFGSKIRFLGLLLLFAAVGLASSCISPKTSKDTAIVLKAENASESDMREEINRFARVNSMRAKMYLKFEDNSFAEFGSKEVYRSADGEIVVQRPGKILMKVQVPVIKTDIVQMTSDGTTFRVAILQDGGSGRYKKFVRGSNAADYSKLKRSLSSADLDDGQKIKESVNAFAEIRPQHFTEAMLVRPIDPADLYTTSTIYQTETDEAAAKNKRSAVRKVERPYYLFDEFVRAADGSLKITRRFWFDRVGGLRLARQQIFDAHGEIESDIVYGQEGNLTDTGEYKNLPLEIQVTRPREKYSMRLRYQMPESVSIGKTYPDRAFVLENSWGLEEVDLDKKLAEAAETVTRPQTQTTVTRFQ